MVNAFFAIRALFRLLKIIIFSFYSYHYFMHFVHIYSIVFVFLYLYPNCSVDTQCVQSFSTISLNTQFKKSNTNKWICRSIWVTKYIYGESFAFSCLSSSHLWDAIFKVFSFFLPLFFIVKRQTYCWILKEQDLSVLNAIHISMDWSLGFFFFFF